MLVSRVPEEPLAGPLPPDRVRTSVLIAMVTLSIYMSALVDLKTLGTFKRHNTLYFWSLLVTSWGIISHSVSVLLKWFVGSCPWAVYTTFSSLGWWGMVTGQSLVLYSRLHLFVRDKRVLRAILTMIIVDFCLFQVPTSVQKFLSGRTNTGTWLDVYHIYERIQLVVFTVQEVVISIVYIRATVAWLSPSDPEGTRRTKHFLIYLNVLCIALDIAIICEVSTNQWVYEEASQSLAYAIKLTLEFAVLNQVMEVHRLGPGGCTECHRRFPSRSLPSIPDEHGAPYDVGETVSATTVPWPRGNSTSSKRLGPYDEEAIIPRSLRVDVVTEIRTVSSPSSVRFVEGGTASEITGTVPNVAHIENREADIMI